MKQILLLLFVFFFLTHNSNAQSLDTKNSSLLIQDSASANGWSPDGKLFVTYTETENKTKLWNLSDSSILWEVSLDPGKQGEDILNTQDFVWSKSQKSLMVSDARGKVYLLNSADGKIIWKNEISKENLKIIRFSPDEKQIIMVFAKENQKTKIEFWSVETGKPKRSFYSDVKLFDSFSFSKNSRILQFGDFEGKAIYIDSLTGRIIKNVVLKPCGNLSNTFSSKTEFNSDLHYLVARCRDKTVITDTATRKILQTLKMKSDSGKSIGFSGDGKIVILEDLGGYKIFKFSDASVKDIDDFDLWFSVDLNYDGTLLMNNSDYKDRGLEIAEVNSGKLLNHFESHPGRIKNLIFNADGSRFASASSDGVIRVWDTANHKIIWAQTANDRGTNAVAFSPDSKILLSAGDNENDINPISVWNAENGKLLRQIASEKDGIKGIERIIFSPNGNLFLTTSESVSFKLWDAKNWTVLKTFKTNESHSDGNMGYCCGSSALTVTFNKSGQQILSAHDDGTIKLWEINKNEPIKTFQVSDHSIRAYFSPDEKQILAISANTETTKLIDAESGRVIQEFKTGNLDKELDYVTDATFLKDGKSFLTTSWYDDVMLWNVSSGKLTKRINIGWSINDEIEISPDGKYFLAGGENQNIMLFDATNGTLIWSLFPINKKLRLIKGAEEAKRFAFVKWREEYAGRADIDNQERVKKIIAKFSHYGDAESFWDQKIVESGVPNKSKLKLPKEKATVAWFTLTNNSDLPVSIDTNSGIVNPKCKGLCSGSEISSRYVMELPDGQTRENGYDFYSKTILSPKTTVYFSVALGHLSASKKIYLGFTFQKDNPEDKESKDYGTEQKLYLPRESELPK